MASSTPQNGSEREYIRTVARDDYDLIQRSMLPFPSLSSLDSGDTSADAVSPSLTLVATPNRLTTQVILPQPVGVIRPPTLGTSPAFTTRTTAPEASPKPLAANKLGEAESVAWTGLETALRALEESADAFPALKSAVGGLVACVDIDTARNREDYDELTSELTTMANTLNQHIGELGSADIHGSIARIALTIEAEVAHINIRQGHGQAERTIEDKEDVVRRYLRIEGLFRQLQSDIGIQTWRNTDEQHMKTLLRSMSPVDDARYNSAYSTTIERHGCTAKTREQVQADLQCWVRDPKAAKIYWMNGMAGTGKTTIAYSLCEWLETNQRLGASFFCSRASSSCRNVSWIIPTIAYQLAQYSSAFQSALCRVLEDDPDASKLNVVRQFEKLVREPAMVAKDAMPEDVVVVIDALDECESNYGVRLVLGTLLRLGANLPLKFFVASRPEPAIRDSMLLPGRYSPTVLHLHDIEESIVEEDIKKYLTDALGSTGPPPSNDQIEQLAIRAGKLFIYAATAVRYILHSSVPANTQLNIMLASGLQATNRGWSSAKYKELDRLYATILTAAFNAETVDMEQMETMRLVLRTAICAKEPMTVEVMSSLLNLTEEQVWSALQPLRSVLHVSEAGGLVSTLHASFLEYMLDPLRSGYFHCDLAQHSEFLAHRCFSVMKQRLRFNICNLESSFVLDKDVLEFGRRVETCISPTLFYTCQYWGEHIQLSGASDELRAKLVDFLNIRLLCWMEVLNLKGCLDRGATIMMQAENWLSVGKGSRDAQIQAADARDFVARFAAGACRHSTPHIYISALPFCSRSSSVYAHYWGRTQGLIDVGGTAIGQRDKAAQATWATDALILSVAFSPDGVCIASGSSDHTIQVRDVNTGDTLAGSFKGHTGWVHSVAFSPDGSRIVSGSKDSTIRVWDAQTGDVAAGPFKGHTSWVNSVAFSPDGTFVVSGSNDQTIRVWDACTGETVIGPFEGHRDWVNSVAFSPDGTRIASGSYDTTIRVWNVRTSDIVAEPFNGHGAGPVYSVAFSPDGTRIVSGSYDQTIRVWDACTGDTIAGPFQGHTNSVRSVMFSPDGTRIVSGSSDQSIQVCDAYSGFTVAGPFKGHTNVVTSVAFSPDGTRIVSGSNDQTIRVWNARTRTNYNGTFEGHKGWIRLVTFSPDGTRIVSVSYDGAIRSWDARTGGAIAEPFNLTDVGHVTSAAFSPNGTSVVSASSNYTIQVRDMCTGDIVAGPLQGHTDLVRSVSFSPDSARILSASDDKTVRMWDIHYPNLATMSLQGHTSAVACAMFSPDGTRIVSSSTDCTIRVWDVCTGHTILGPLKGHTSSIFSVGFSRDGTRIVSGSADLTIRVWDACTGKTIAGPFKGHTGHVNSVSFSPDGGRVVSGSKDGTVQAWDVQTGGTVAGPFRGHTNWVYSVAFSPDGTRVASGSADRTIRVWDASVDDISVPYPDPAGLVSLSMPPLNDTHLFYSINTNHRGHSSSEVPANPISHSAQIDCMRSPLRDVGDFNLHSDGWVTAGNILLFWVSPDFRDHLPYPQNTLVIGPQGTTLIDYRRLLLGEQWSECYKPK